MAWLDELVDFAHQQLGDREIEALWMRGVSDEQIELFRLGHLNRKIPDLGEAGKAFRLRYKGTSWLTDSFVLPLTNTLGQVKGIQLRHVDSEKKGYSRYLAYKEEPVLFGLGQAAPRIWEANSVWVTEGAFDLFPVQRVCPNVVATLTNRLTERVGRTLRRMADELWLAYDMDSKGREAVERVYRQHRRRFEKIHDVLFPRVSLFNGERAKDPAELWEAWGDSKFQDFLRQELGPLMEN